MVSTGSHRIGCRWSEGQGRHPRHVALSGIIHRALLSAHVPAKFEPPSSTLQRWQEATPCISVAMEVRQVSGVVCHMCGYQAPLYGCAVGQCGLKGLGWSVMISCHNN